MFIHTTSVWAASVVVITTTPVPSGRGFITDAIASIPPPLAAYFSTKYLTIYIFILGKVITISFTGVPFYFNMFAFALGVVMSVIFTLVHNGDRASQELFINNYFGRCASTVATSIHATHVVMCGMFVRVQAGIYYYSGLTTESVIMMTYCHMVEVLWLVIMTTTMLSHV
jgi:hypothetical protein